MKSISIYITYETGGETGSMTIRLPAWLDEGRPTQRKFWRLAAKHADQFENRHEIAVLREYLQQAIRETKEVSADEKPARRAENRPENRLKRYEQALADLDEALSKYAK